MSGKLMKIRSLFMALSISLATAPLLAQPGPAGRGGRGPDRAAQRADMELFHYLLDHRKSVERSVKELSDGVETNIVRARFTVSNSLAGLQAKFEYQV